MGGSMGWIWVGFFERFLRVDSLLFFDVSRMLFIKKKRIKQNKIQFLKLKFI